MPLLKNQTYLRWAGGKRRLVWRLLRFVPTDFEQREYYEPFLGAGSLFVALQPRSSFLSDMNADLINSYRSVRDNPDLVARYLRQHARFHSEEHYYAVREDYNRAHYFSGAQSARFIYLNRTCFNGIFRVNLDGEFNVPFGKPTNPLFPDLEHLRVVSRAFTNSQLNTLCYHVALEKAGTGAFV